MCNTMNDLSEIASKIYELEKKKAAQKKKLDELEVQIKSLKDETASYMRKRQKKELEINSFKVLYTPYARPQFDKNAFIANEDNGKELYEKYCKSTPIQRVTVKLSVC